MDWLTPLAVVTGSFGLVILLLVTYFVNFRRNNFWSSKNIPFEPEQSLKFNFSILFSGKMYWQVDQEWCQKHGRIFGCYQMNQPMLFVTDPDVIRRIFVKDFHLFPDRRVLNFQDRIANNFLTILRGDDWKRVRSVITPAFSTGKLKKMVSLMSECAEITSNNLIKIADNEGTVDCKKMFSAFTLDIIANTAFGTKLNSSSDPDNVFVRNARKMFNVNFPWRLILNFAFPRLCRVLGIRPFSPSVMNFFEELTHTVARKRKESKEDRGDFLQNLLEAQMRGEGTEFQTKEEEMNEDKHDLSEESQSFLKQYSKNRTISMDEFVATCVLFFLAGFDTTATTLSMTAYHLALNPECQKKVVEEVDQVWKDHPEGDYQAISKLKYLDAAISETLRLHPPLPRLERLVSTDYYIEEANVTIPKDMVVGFPIYAMHMDPEFFPDPETYNPGRFLPENREQIRPYTYLPFGDGPRNCLGMRFALMEIKLCLFHVFKHVTFEVCPETKIPPEIYKGSGLYQPKSIDLRVVKRVQ